MSRGGGGSSNRTLVEDCICLDISALRKGGYLKPKGAITVPWSWKCRDGFVTKAVLDINMADETYGPRIFVQIGGVEKPQLVYLECTSPHFGGERWWFICFTGSRCSKLYLPHGGSAFQCREALSLTYTSQHLAPALRQKRRARQLRARLEATEKSGFYPGKPKGMWHRTHQKLLHRVMDTEDKSRHSMTQWMSRRFGQDWMGLRMRAV
jgi:hypothetical protein